MAANPCTTCDGCGKLDSEEKKPWSRFNGIPYSDPRMAKVAAGEVQPVKCPACKSTGFAPESKPEAKK